MADRFATMNDPDENDVDDEFDVERMLSAEDVSSSSSAMPAISKSSRHQQHKHAIPTRKRSRKRSKNAVHVAAATSFALVGCVAILGTLSTTSDLQNFTRFLQAGTRRLASCVVSMAVDEADASIESTFPTWESMFSLAFLNEKQREWCEQHGGCHSNHAPSLPPETDLAFIISLTTCPDDEDQPGVDNRHDPRRAFYDAVSIFLVSSLVQQVWFLDNDHKYSLIFQL